MAGQPGQVPDKNKPTEEFINEIGRRAYTLEKFEESSLKSIEQRLSAGEQLPQDELSHYLGYLDEMSHKVREILQHEKAEGIANMELERQLRKIVQMLNQVSAMLDKF